MKIGIFDSGVGGLIVARAIHKLMPNYDYVYLGDTKNVPYGPRPESEVLKFTEEGVRYLLNKEDCALVIIACNTASARALRKIQRKYDKVLGVLIPAAEEAAKWGSVGVMATIGSVKSGTFIKEIKKLNKNAKISQVPAPELVPMIEAGEYDADVLKNYLNKFKNIDALVLGCTHYPILKQKIRKILPKNVKIISQDEIVPKKLKNYLARHPEIAQKLSKNKKVKILVTKKTKTTDSLAGRWFSSKIKPKVISL